MKNKILTVITESIDRKKAELNAQVYRILVTAQTADDMIAAPIFAKLGVRVEDQFGQGVILIGPSELVIHFNFASLSLKLHRFKRSTKGQIVPKERLAKVDFVDLLTNPYHQFKEMTRINPDPFSGNYNQDVNDLLYTQQRERYLYSLGTRTVYNNGQRTRLEPRYIIDKAEQRTGLSVNRGGKPRIIKRQK